MNFEINLNETTSETMVDGWMSFSARGTQDGVNPAKKFFVKTPEGDKKVLTAIEKDGVVFDIYNMKHGWQQFADGRSNWQFNENLTVWQARPGDDWSKGISIPIAVNNDKLVIWRQSGVSTMEGIQTLTSKIGGQAVGKLPLVKMIDTKPLKFKSGTSTTVPIFDILDWVERPFILEAKQDENAPPQPAQTETVELPANSEF